MNTNLLKILILFRPNNGNKNPVRTQRRTKPVWNSPEDIMVNLYHKDETNPALKSVEQKI
jgi:hypothetical protein